MEKKVANVSERLKLAMKDAQCSQSELSRMTRIDRAAISRYLSGAYEPKQDAVERMACSLGVTERWLSGYDAPKMAITPNINKKIADAALRMQDDPTFREAVELIDGLSAEEMSAIATMIRTMRK